MAHPSPTTADAARPEEPGAPAGSGTRRTPTAGVKMVGMTLGLGAVLVVLLGLFILPSLKGGAHDLPVGTVGTPEATRAFEEAVARTAPDAYEMQPFDTAEELEEAVRQRDVFGGFVLEEGEVRAVVASAGSTAISGTLAGTAAAVAEVTDAEVDVVDVVPLPADDPTGVGIGGLAFPLVFGGIVPVVAFRALFPRSNAGNVVALTLFSAVGGTLVATVLRFWFGSIDSNFWPVAAAMALGIAGLALPLAGLQQALGAKGFTAGAASMMFLGNPFSGIATTGAWLPAGLGTFGQILPPGAAGSLVRSAAYFDWAGALAPAATLLGWVALGLVLLAVASRRARREPATA